MTETKKLVMVFKNSVGKNVSISIDDPKDNITDWNQDNYGAYRRKKHL